MHDEHDPITASAQDPQPENLLEQLAAKREVVARNKETFVPVPGYDREPPLLLMRYRLLEGPEINRIGDKIKREVRGAWDRQLMVAVDTLIAACQGVYVDLEGDGKPKPLTLGGEPILGFNEELAKALKFDGELSDPPTARSVVFGLFAKNDVALSKHAFMLSSWMSDTSIEVSQDMLAGNL